MTGRIAAVLSSSPPMRFVGGELATHALLRRLAGLGWQVQVRCLTAPMPWVWDGLQVVPHRAGDLVDVDVLLTHPDVDVDGRATADAADAALAYVVHNTDQATLVELGRRRADLVLFAADNTRVQVQTLFPDVDGPVAPPVVEGVDTRGTDFQDRVTCVNVADAKGGLLFMYAARELRHLRFLAVAGGWGMQAVRDGDLPNLQVLGQMWPTQMHQNVYARTRILVMPTRKESYGMVGVEAMHSGIPVVASDLPGTREALGDAALYIPVGDLPALISAITTLDDPGLYRQHHDLALTRAAQQQQEADAGVAAADTALRHLTRA